MDLTFAKKKDGLFLGFFDGEAESGARVCGARLACVVAFSTTKALGSLGGVVPFCKEKDFQSSAHSRNDSEEHTAKIASWSWMKSSRFLKRVYSLSGSEGEGINNAKRLIYST
jgi:hypothetical protein